MLENITYGVGSSLSLVDGECDLGTFSDLNDAYKIRGRNHLDVIVSMDKYDRDIRRILFRWDHNIESWRESK